MNNIVHSASFARARVASTDSLPIIMRALVSVGGGAFWRTWRENRGAALPKKLRRRPPLGQTNALVKMVEEVLTFDKYLLVIQNVLSLSSLKKNPLIG